MDFDDYQKKAITTDLFNKSDNKELFSIAFLEKLLGITGEAGELADKIKKILRDKEGVLNEEDKKEITKELGDILWYVSAVAYYLDVPFHQIAEDNLQKLLSRKDRGVLNGQGDNR